MRTDRQLRWSAMGRGRTIVLLHGYPDNLQIWSALAPRLSDRFRVIAFDWPGMGLSDAWKGGATPYHMAERLLDLLNFWEIERVTVIGMDMGGQPALVFASIYPDRTDGLVVMNSLVMADERTSWEIRLLRRFGWNRVILRHFPNLVFGRAERTFLPKDVRLEKDVRMDMWDTFSRREVREFIIRMCAGYQGSLPRLPECYPRIRCPALVLWGECDAHFPPVHAERLHDSIPGSRLDIVPNAEHWMAWYRAEEIAERIMSFNAGKNA